MAAHCAGHNHILYMPWRLKIKCSFTIAFCCHNRIGKEGMPVHAFVPHSRMPQTYLSGSTSVDMTSNRLLAWVCARCCSVLVARCFVTSEHLLEYLLTTAE